jgi:alpha-beta hydrolase superfamily lysophospholipase
MDPLMRAALWLTANTLPWVRVTGEGLNIKPSDNRAMLIALGRDPLVIKRTRFDAISGLTDLMDNALEAAPALNIPALILYGQHDEIIPKPPVCQMLEDLPAGVTKHWRMVVYPEGYHMLTRDLHAQTVYRDLGAWLTDPKSALPSGHELGPNGMSQAGWCTET